MKQRGVFLIGLFLITCYFFIFPRQSGRELVISPIGLVSLESGGDSTVMDTSSLLALKSNDLAGFFDRERRLVSLYSSERMAVDDRWIAVSEPDSVRILDPDGRLRSRIAVRAYPISRNGHLYLYNGSAGRLKRVDPSNGRVMWTKEYLASVTVLDGRQNRTLVGLLDGRIEVISEDGDVELEYRPGGSRVEAVYGGALSESGSSVALITGLDPQRFILMEERKNGFRPISHHDTQTDFRRSVPVQFVRGGRQVLYEASASIASFDVESGLISSINFPGTPVAWEDSSSTGALIVAGRQEGSVGLRMLSRYDRVLYEAALPSSTTDLRLDDDEILIVGDRYVGILEMTVQ